MEWLEFPPPADPRPRRRRLLAGIVGVVVAAVVVSLAIWHSRSEDDRSDQPAPGPTGAASTTRPTSLPTRTDTSPGPAVQTRPVPAFLSDHDLDVFARSTDTVYRIQTRRRLITATALLTVDTNGPASFVAGSHQVLTGGFGPGEGQLIVDGRPPQALPGRLAQGDMFVAGPGDTIWVRVADQEQGRWILVDEAGRPTARPAFPSEGAGYLLPDGAGGLLSTGVGGSYQVTTSGFRRITRGGILAVGPRHYLTTDCDDRYRCTLYRYDRSTHQQHEVGPNTLGDYGDGRISADGHYAAILTFPNGTPSTVVVLDLTTGRILDRRAERFDSQLDANSLNWLPDDLLLRLHDGALTLYDPRTRHTTTPDLRLPSLVQVTVRR